MFQGSNTLADRQLPRGWVALFAAAVFISCSFAFLPLCAAGDGGAGDGASRLDPEFGVGSWIWTETASDKQTARFWRAFEIPAGAAVTHARFRITADNGYRLFLDGRELGRGSDWRSLTEYDLTWLLEPGRHVLAVEAFNDRLQAGVLAGMRIELSDMRVIEFGSDENWRVVPEPADGWESKLHGPASWPAATVVGAFGEEPRETKPYAITAVPAFQPVVRHFWQSGWFQVGLVSMCGLTLLICLWLAAKLALQSKAQVMLQRERARIARDIHDDVGSGLTELVLQGEVAQTEFPEGSPARSRLDQLCEKARSVSHALEEVVWAVNSRRDTVRDFASYACKYAQTFFKGSLIRCRLDVESELPQMAMDLAVRRNLFLAVKEALNNVARHSEATEVYLRIHRRGPWLEVVIEDDGRGFAPGEGFEGNGLMNMEERLKEAGGSCRVRSRPGAGCRVEFRITTAGGKKTRSSWLRRSAKAEEEFKAQASGGADPVTRTTQSQA